MSKRRRRGMMVNGEFVRQSWIMDRLAELAYWNDERKVRKVNRRKVKALRRRGRARA